jgi:cyclophilin family peptidyl-prolyl cis-trans isomerase
MTHSLPNRTPRAIAVLALATATAAALGIGPIAVIPSAATQTAPASPPTTPTPAPPPAPPAAAPLLARVQTAKGSFTIELRVAEAPITCANFVNLVRRGAYDRSAVHDATRVIRQSGGPGRSFYPGYVIRREFSAKLMFEGPGMVAMQKAPDGEHAHGTQFFVTVKEQSRWNLDIPIFATVSRGQDVVNMLEMGDAIERIELDGNPAPLLARFAKEIAAWNTALDAAMAQAKLPPLRPAAEPAATPPAAPVAPPAHP